MFVPFSPVLGFDFQHTSISEDTTFEELHDIERGTNDRDIFTKDDRFWDRNPLRLCGRRILVMSVEGTEDFEFTLDLMSRLR